jgi:hypothetical protein
MPVTDEQKERKNEMRRLNGARNKAIISPEPVEEPVEEKRRARRIT